MQSHTIILHAILPAVLAVESSITSSLPVTGTSARVATTSKAIGSSPKLVGSRSDERVHSLGRQLSEAVCFDDCYNLTNDGICDDGGPGAEFNACSSPGFDCGDCGPRNSTNETAPFPPLPAGSPEYLSSSEPEQASFDTRITRVLPVQILVGVFVGLTCCLFFICFCTVSRRSKKPKTEPPKKGSANADEATATAEEITGEVDGGIGGMGKGSPSDAVGAGLVDGERLSPVRESDVRVVAEKGSTDVEPTLLDSHQSSLPTHYECSKETSVPSLDEIIATNDIDDVDAAATSTDDGIRAAASIDEAPPDTETAADAFVKALRAGLGLKTVLTPREGSSDAGLHFDAAIETELRTLFKRCDRDASNTIGRGEFARALRILSLDKNLQIYGGDHGVVSGMERLFRDLQTSEGGGISEDQFVNLFVKLVEAEHAQKPEPSPRRNVPNMGKGKSSFDRYEELQRQKYEDEMALAITKQLATTASSAPKDEDELRREMERVSRVSTSSWA